MRGRTQAEWLHRVPKAPALQGERVNLTFRFVTPTLMPGLVKLPHHWT